MTISIAILSMRLRPSRGELIGGLAADVKRRLTVAAHDLDQGMRRSVADHLLQSKEADKPGRTRGRARGLKPDPFVSLCSAFAVYFLNSDTQMGNSRKVRHPTEAKAASIGSTRLAFNKVRRIAAEVSRAWIVWPPRASLKINRFLVPSVRLIHAFGCQGIPALGVGAVLKSGL